MNFSRTESIVLYTCSALFSLMIFFIFYRVFLIAWRRFLLKVRPESLEPSDARQERRVRELLQRPSLRDLLASRAEFVQERQKRQNEAELKRELASDVVSRAPDGRRTKVQINENKNTNISQDGTIHFSGDHSVQNQPVLPPPYDSLSVYSGPPPSYHSDDNSWYLIHILNECR